MSSENEKNPREQGANWKAPETTDAVQKNNESETPKLEETKELNFNESDKHRLQALSDSIRSLSARLREREDSRLDALIEPGNLGRLAAASREIEELTIDSKASLQDYETALLKLAAALETFGNVQRRSMLRDDPDNLRRINFHIRQIADAALELRSGLGAKEQKQFGQIIRNLRRIDADLEKVWQWIAKKANMLKDRY